MMLEAFILAALVWSGVVQVWHVYVLSFILGAVNAVDVPVRQAFTVEMVEGKEDLTNAIGLNAAMFNLGRALGPALAGILVAATGASMAFFLNGLTFIAVLVCLSLMKIYRRHRPSWCKEPISCLISRKASCMFGGIP